MSAPVSAQRMVDLIGQKVEDKLHTRWDKNQKVFAIDQAVQHLLNIQGENFEEHDLDYVDINVTTETSFSATMSATGQGLKEWRVPDYVYKIRLIEDTTDSSHPRTIPCYPLNLKEQFRAADTLNPPRAFWVFTQRGDFRTRIGFVGELNGVSTLRVWFIRRAAPLHFGVARAGATPGSNSTRIWFSDPAAAATTFGRIINRGTTYLDSTGATVSRADVYVGALIEFGTASGGAAQIGVSDEIRCLVSSAYIQVDVGPTRDWVWTFDAPLRDFANAATPLSCASFNYSLIPQIGPEHHELVTLMASVRLAEEAGAQRTIEILRPKMQDLYTAFVDATQVRQHQNPEFVQVIDQEWF